MSDHTQTKTANPQGLRLLAGSLFFLFCFVISRSQVQILSPASCPVRLLGFGQFKENHRWPKIGLFCGRFVRIHQVRNDDIRERSIVDVFARLERDRASRDPVIRDAQVNAVCACRVVGCIVFHRLKSLQQTIEGQLNRTGSGDRVLGGGRKVGKLHVGVGGG
jgi:hypothetical protein